MAGIRALNDLRLAEHGAQLFQRAALADLPELEAAMDALPPTRLISGSPESRHATFEIAPRPCS